MLIRHRDREPVVDPSAFVAPTAVVAGNVRVGPRVRVMYGKEALAAAIQSLGFARTAFGVDALWEDRVARYRQATEVRSREFDSHAHDTIVQDW